MSEKTYNKRRSNRVSEKGLEGKQRRNAERDCWIVWRESYPVGRYKRSEQRQAVRLPQRFTSLPTPVDLTLKAHKTQGSYL